MALAGMGRDPTMKPEWGAPLDRTHILAQGMALCLPLNEAGSRQAGDVVNGYVGSLSGGVTWGANGRGETLVLDGSSGYVDLSSCMALLPAAVATVEIGVKVVSPGASYRRLVNLNPRWGCYLKDGVLMAYDFGAGADRSSGVNLADGKWHHVVFVFRSGIANGCQFWVDGTPVYTFTAAVDAVASLVDAAIGGASGGAQCIAGTVERVSIWNRALSGGEVLSLYTQPYGLFLSGDTRRFYGLGQAWQQALTEMLAWTDGRRALVGKVASEVWGLIEGRGALANKPLNDALTLADALAALLNTGGQAFSKLLMEVLAWTDARQAGTRKPMAETLNLTDSRLLALARQLGEALGFTDGVQATGAGLAVLTLVTSGAFGDRLMRSGCGDKIGDVGGKA